MASLAREGVLAGGRPSPFAIHASANCATVRSPFIAASATFTFPAHGIGRDRASAFPSRRLNLVIRQHVPMEQTISKVDELLHWCALQVFAGEAAGVQQRDDRVDGRVVLHGVVR
jgi:hypothetical protein